MFFGKSVEDDEVLPIALQACRGWFLATSAEPCAQTIAQTLTLLARGRLRERCQLRADLLVQPLGHLVEHVQSAVVPTPLVTGGGEDLVQRRPQPQCAIADRQQRRLVEASLLE